MRAWNGFGRALGFALLAALGWWAVEPWLAGALGARGALRLCLLALPALYLMGLAPSRRRVVATSAAAGAAGALLWLLPLGMAATAVAAAGIVAAGRSGVLYRSRPWRACLAEAALGVAGLGLAGFLAGGSAASVALALWGYFLVQSAFFLIGGVAPRRTAAPGDPFDRAAAALEALLS